MSISFQRLVTLVSPTNVAFDQIPSTAPHDGGHSVGVLRVALTPYRASIASRISRTEVPARCIRIASRAMSTHSVQPKPCADQATSPLAAREATKQSRFERCPRRSHPQKQGTYFSTSGCCAAKTYASTTASRGRAKWPRGSGGRPAAERRSFAPGGKACGVLPSTMSGGRKYAIQAPEIAMAATSAAMANRGATLPPRLHPVSCFPLRECRFLAMRIGPDRASYAPAEASFASRRSSRVFQIS